jgi:DNA-binding NarL/FixJ family response regulator
MPSMEKRLTMRILLADDQAEVRSALRLLLEHGLSHQVVGEVREGSSLLEKVQQARPDLLLVDWELPGPPVARLLRGLYSERPELKIIVLSGYMEAQQASLDAGASGFVFKGDSPSHLLALLHAMNGRGDN